MNLQSKFGYCMTTQTLNIALCKQDGITDRRKDRRGCPRHLSGRGHKNVLNKETKKQELSERQQYAGSNHK